MSELLSARLLLVTSLELRPNGRPFALVLAFLLPPNQSGFKPFASETRSKAFSE